MEATTGDRVRRGNTVAASATCPDGLKLAQVLECSSTSTQFTKHSESEQLVGGNAVGATCRCVCYMSMFPTYFMYELGSSTVPGAQQKHAAVPKILTMHPNVISGTVFQKAGRTHQFTPPMQVRCSRIVALSMIVGVGSKCVVFIGSQTVCLQLC